MSMRRVALLLWRHKIVIVASCSAVSLTSFKVWSTRQYLPKYDSKAHQYWQEHSKTPIEIESIRNRRQQVSELKRHCISSNPQYNRHKIPYDNRIIQNDLLLAFEKQTERQRKLNKLKLKKNKSSNRYGSSIYSKYSNPDTSEFYRQYSNSQAISSDNNGHSSVFSDSGNTDSSTSNNNNDNSNTRDRSPFSSKNNKNGKSGIDKEDSEKSNKIQYRKEYDILVIGGGATGCGIALDATSRGLEVALVEKSDFASGTSGRSTKLIHGGVRYLEKAILQLDKGQWDLVREAIAERSHLINITPHLSFPIPIIIPAYDRMVLRGYWNLAKFFVGAKIYEAMAGADGLLCPSYYLSSPHARNIFPQLQQKNLVGSIVYFDGIHNDSRMCLSIALTASSLGCTIANHVECVDFIKDMETDKIIGARLRDNLTGEEWNTYAKVVVNATGAFVDNLRQKDNPYQPSLVIPSQGTHLILPGTFSPQKFGMLIPKTEDGRVAFMLPWENSTIAGTTDEPCSLSDLPRPTQSEAKLIIDELNKYLDMPVDLSDVDAAWTGIRPLAVVPDNYQVITQGAVNIIKPDSSLSYQHLRQKKYEQDRAEFVKKQEKAKKIFQQRRELRQRRLRQNIIDTSSSIDGSNSNNNQDNDSSGNNDNDKSMTDSINGDNGSNSNDGSNKSKSSESSNKMNTSKISRHHVIEIAPSGLYTITGGKWTTYRRMSQDVVDEICLNNPDLANIADECATESIKLIGSAGWTSSVPAILERHQIPHDIANHLSRNYGDKSFIVGNLYLNKWNQRLAGGYCYTEAEVIYASQYEMAETAIDVLSRRTRLAQVNRGAAEYALPRVIELMGEVHQWDSRTRVEQYHDACEFLRTMHVKDRHKWGRSRHTVEYARRVVETVLGGPSMTDEAIKFVIDSFMEFYEENEHSSKNNLMKYNISNNIVGYNNNDNLAFSDENDNEIVDIIANDDNNNNSNEIIEINQSRAEYLKQKKKHTKARKVFEGCITREQCYKLAEKFANVFGDDRVIDALMFTGMNQLGLYEILVSCASCAADPHLFDPPGPWIVVGNEFN